MIRRVDLDELTTIYNERITADFPASERRPLFLIKRLFRKGRYVALVLEEEGQVAAYATFICDDAVQSVFLDYYAVDKAQRGQGTGSRFLAMLQAYWAEKGGIILECEEPDTAADEGEKETRLRRISFYERGGAVVTKVRWHAFGVDYRILYLKTKTPVEQVDVPKDLLKLYSFSMPSFVRRMFSRIQT